jgi:glycosyltransferase involved in cell wall biosynthesis
MDRIPLSILMLTHKSPFGAGQRSLAMAKELVKQGHAATILLISKKNRTGYVEYDIDGVHAVETPDMLWGRLRSGWDPWNIINRISYLRRTKEKFNLIHCFETRPATIYPSLNYSHRYHIPIITDWNDWWGRDGLIEVNRPSWYSRSFFSSIEVYYEEAFRPRTAGLTTISTALKKRAIKLGIDPERICYIPGGAFTKKYPVLEKIDCRKKANFPLDIPILGFCSADSHLDLEIVMAALVIVKQKFPRIKLIITGRTKPGINNMVEQYGLSENVLLTGFLSEADYPVYLSCSDIFLLPMEDKLYNHGRWPNKMSDYLCFGRPTVTNPIGDVKTLFETHEVGLLADGNPQDFAEKILFLLSHPQEAERLGKNARITAETEYEWGILTSRLEEFYYKILDMKHQTSGRIL